MDIDKLHRTRGWLKTFALCAITGGSFGAAIGAIIATTSDGARLIGITAGIMAMICAVPGSRFGFFFGHVNRIRFGRLFVGSVAAVGGAILGGLFGVVASMPLGALIGGLGGWFFARAISERDYRFRNGLLGAYLGPCLVVVVLTLQRDQVAALPGAIWGLGIGAIIGPILFLLLMGTMDLLLGGRSR